MAAKRMAAAGMMTALALALAYLEALVPLQAVIPLPGVRLGLANIVTLFALVSLGKGYAVSILAARCALQAAMFGSVASFCFSISGGFLAMLVMICMLPKYGVWFSAVGMSAAGAAAHQIGQIFCAAVFFQTAAVFSYLPVLLAVGLVSGCLTGMVCILALGKLKKLGFLSDRLC